MKRWIMGMALCLLLLLMFTNSLYVEWGELASIIAVLSLASVIFFRNRNWSYTIFTSSALIGFLFCWVFGAADIIFDHYLYFPPTEASDGPPLSLGFKLEEFSDDLTVGSIYSMLIVLVVNFLTKMVSLAYAKTS